MRRKRAFPAQIISADEEDWYKFYIGYEIHVVPTKIGQPDEPEDLWRICGMGLEPNQNIIKFKHLRFYDR